MNVMTKALLDAVDWRTVRTAVSSAEAVPQALAALFAADTIQRIPTGAPRSGPAGATTTSSNNSVIGFRNEVDRHRHDAN